PAFGPLGVQLRDLPKPTVMSADLAVHPSDVLPPFLPRIGTVPSAGLRILRPRWDRSRHGPAGVAGRGCRERHSRPGGGPVDLSGRRIRAVGALGGALGRGTGWAGVVRCPRLGGTGCGPSGVLAIRPVRFTSGRRRFRPAGCGAEVRAVADEGALR